MLILRCLYWQVSAPEYVFLISDLAGERRFASAVAKRLESLGALTHGDRRATKTRDLSQYNVYTKYGRLALTNVMRAITGTEGSRVPPPADYKGDFFPGILFVLGAKFLSILLLLFSIVL